MSRWRLYISVNATAIRIIPAPENRTPDKMNAGRATIDDAANGRLLMSRLIRQRNIGRQYKLIVGAGQYQQHAGRARGRHRIDIPGLPLLR